MEFTVDIYLRARKRSPMKCIGYRDVTVGLGDRFDFKLDLLSIAITI